MNEFLYGNQESGENAQENEAEKTMAQHAIKVSQLIDEDNAPNNVEQNTQDDYYDKNDGEHYEDDGGDDSYDDYYDVEEDDYSEYDDDDYDDDQDDYDDDDYDDDYDDDQDEEIHFGKERSDFYEDKISLQEIPIPKYILERYSFIKELPSGIAVMGGVARSIAREIITGEREPIRDIDLVNIWESYGKTKVDGAKLDALSRKYMPDDYAYGHGIQSCTLSGYFRSRDFTINQCIVIDDKLIVSNFAYNDFEENIIRPTYYNHLYDGDEMNSQSFLKAIMMRGVLSQISESIPLIEIEDEGRPYDIGYFDIALYLNKAMSRGAETACIFTKDLYEWDIIPEKYVDRPIALAKMLVKNVYSFKFRPATDKRFMDIQEHRDVSGYFIPQSMKRYYSSDPEIRRAMAEYEDDSDNFSTDNMERYSGYYTEAEYDSINYSAD